MSARQYRLYLIGPRDADIVKIGVAYNPTARCRELQTGSDRTLAVLHEAEVPNAYEIEARLHRMLKAERIRGEWFAISVATALNAIERAKAIASDPASTPRAGEPRQLVAPRGCCPFCDKYRDDRSRRMRAWRAKQQEAE
jgi:hypothetical protein